MTCSSESKWISIKNAPQEISKCFKPPFSNKMANPIFQQSDTLGTAPLNSTRNIILVGHDIMTDVNYLKKIGYDPSNLSNLQELIDTSHMYRAFKREPHPRNLGSILASLDIAGWYLHNAGNDAVYTLQAMVGIAITALLERSNEKSREKESEMRIAE
jgi:DNA polymerase III alpha subunit (gram-positive type)